MKKIYSITIIICIIFSLIVEVKPQETKNNKLSLEELLNEDITTMTTYELNSYINKIADFCMENESQVSVYSTDDEIPGLVGQAWLAAAEIARDEGYECAAIAVECSVNNVDITETTHITYGDGPFLKKIKTTFAYQNYLTALLKSGKLDDNSSFVISKSDNSDLFYALHNVAVSASGTLVGTSNASYIITVTDVFDFAYDNDYDDLFTTLVNNWAWLCQQTDVLHPINIKLMTIGGY